MRDNHEKMPEILDTFEEGGNAFAIVALEREQQILKFRIGITPAGYKALKRVLQFHPFEKIPGTKYRYFFSGSASKKEPSGYQMGVRVERGKDGKQFYFEAPKELIQNMVWFYQTKDLREAEDLKIR